MSKSIFSAPHFTDEGAAYAYVEARLWANGRVCPHCGVVDRSGALKGKSNRVGLYKCYACRKPFSVKVGTIFEASHIAMRDWLVAIHMICSSKKGVSANQLHRTLGITLKSAWFMAHRIREAMKPGGKTMFGNDGGTVEADESFIGKKEGIIVPKTGHHMHAIVALVERGGAVRSFYLPELRRRDVQDVVGNYVSPKAHLRTDESSLYNGMDHHFASHKAVNHGKKEYARGEVSTNTVEGVFSIFKRGMIGTYQHCGSQHLQRYLAEFDFRYSNRTRLGINDTMRADAALKGATGKRLTYRTTGGR
jgi:transposase-like protein